MHVLKMCLPKWVVAIIMRVPYKDSRNPTSLSKCINEPLDVTKNVVNFL